MSPEERAAAFFAGIPEFDGTLDEAFAAAQEDSKLRMAEKWGVTKGSPKWADLFGIDPDYTEGVPVDEWLEQNRGEA